MNFWKNSSQNFKKNSPAIEFSWRKVQKSLKKSKVDFNLPLLTLKNLSDCSWRLGSFGKLNLGVSAIIGLSARSSGVGLSYEPKSSPMSRVSLQVHTSFSMVMGVKVPRYEAGRCGMSSPLESRLNPVKF